jgi:hypothetical protein
MNTTRRTSTLFSLIGAALMTLAMLAGVDGLATNDGAATHLVQTTTSAAKA